MKRSDLLCGACAAVAGAVLAAPSAALADPAHWNYESTGDDGPAHWGGLEPDFKSCAIGTQQSPIDLSGPVRASVGALTMSYQASPLRIINNGHTIQVNYAPGSSFTIHGRTYEVSQFHFHNPSEHKVNGKNYPLEMHIVHTDASKNLAVVGVFFAEGAPNKALDTIWNAAPATAGPEQSVGGVSFNVASLVPSSTAAYYEYLGSLTTPPCTENVKWVVLAVPNTASATQLAKFKGIFAHNARPTQPINQRLLLQTAV